MKRTLFIILLFFISLASFSQAKRIVILGSSTSAGVGPSTIDSAYVNRYAAYLTSLGAGHTLVNLAVSGFGTYSVMPTGYTDQDALAIDTSKNITKAFSLNPTTILVNLPTNDATTYTTVTPTMRRFRELKRLCDSAGVDFWITTSQPRNTGRLAQDLILYTRDSIIAQFPTRYINFYKDLGDDGGSILSQFNVDNIHMNAAAHDTMLKRVVRANLIAAAPNLNPTINAGADQSFNYLTTSTSVTATGSDADGTIVSYLWTVVSGAGTVTAPSSATTGITGIGAGVLILRCIITDNLGATAFDDVSITRAANTSPVINAGSDQSFNYLTTSTSVTAIASDAEGSSLTYAWTQISGTAATIVSPSSATTSITSIGTGTSVFRCTVSDGTTTSFDDVTVTVVAKQAGLRGRWKIN